MFVSFRGLTSWRTKKTLDLSVATGVSHQRNVVRLFLKHDNRKSFDSFDSVNYCPLSHAALAR